MDNSRILEKVEKCLSLASGCNEYEVALALQTAQGLMDKYSITIEDVKLSEISRYKAAMGNEKKPARYMWNLVDMVCSIFGCKPVLSPGWGFKGYKTTVEFIGFGPSPAIAAYAFDILKHKLIKGRRECLETLIRYRRQNIVRKADAWAEAWVLSVRVKVKKLVLDNKKETLILKWKSQTYRNLASQRPNNIKIKKCDNGAIKSAFSSESDEDQHDGITGSSDSSLLQ